MQAGKRKYGRKRSLLFDQNTRLSTRRRAYDTSNWRLLLAPSDYQKQDEAGRQTRSKINIRTAGRATRQSPVHSIIYQQIHDNFPFVHRFKHRRACFSPAAHSLLCKSRFRKHLNGHRSRAPNGKAGNGKTAYLNAKCFSKTMVG